MDLCSMQALHRGEKRIGQSSSSAWTDFINRSINHPLNFIFLPCTSLSHQNKHKALNERTIVFISSSSAWTDLTTIRMTKITSSYIYFWMIVQTALNPVVLPKKYAFYVQYPVQSWPWTEASVAVTLNLLKIMNCKGLFYFLSFIIVQQNIPYS